MTESKIHTHTSTGSKNAIFTFIATFIVCLFLFGNSVGQFTGVIFFFVGILTVSVIVAMPFYFYKKKHLKVPSIISMTEFLVTVILTIMAFLYFFTNPLDLTATASPSDNNPSIVICDEPIPAFALGMEIIPNKVQADAICSCIWKALSPLDKNLSASLTKNENHSPSQEQLRLFISKIGVATESCKTKNL